MQEICVKCNIRETRINLKTCQTCADGQHRDYVDNMDRRKEKSRKWNADNPEKIRKACKKYNQYKKDFVNDLKVKIKCQNPKCQWVGEFCSCDLDYHHIDKKDKIGCIAIMINGNVHKLVAEINKCTILCAICHRRATHGLLNFDGFNKCRVKVGSNNKPIHID